MLRHQLNMLCRRVPSKPKLVVADRLLFVWLFRLFPSVLNAINVVQPETIIRWHRTGFGQYWRWKSRSRGGRARIPAEIRRLIRDISLANRLWGAPRIHGELLKLGIEVAQSTVDKYMAKSGELCLPFKPSGHIRDGVRRGVGLLRVTQSPARDDQEGRLSRAKDGYGRDRNSRHRL